MPPPTGPPLGLRLANTAKAVSQAFDDALAAAGGSRSSWLVLMSLKARPAANQRELAAAVGIQGATLTQHLNTMENDGLLTRRRAPDNRRVHLVELTEQGEIAFHQMREAAVAFDHQLRASLDDHDIAHLEHLLDQLHDNVADQAKAIRTDSEVPPRGRRGTRESGLN